MKRKVLFVVHQLNLGGVQKALISALNALDYSENEVTLYVRKNRADLLPQVNRNVSKIIINQDTTKYYRKPYAIWLQLLLKINNSQKTKQRLNDYIVSAQMKYEKEHYFSDDVEYDLAVSYIQSYTAKFVDENVKAKRKVMFYHGSTDEFHDVNEKAMQHFERIYCVSKGAQKAVQGFYPQYTEKIDCLENYVDAESVRQKANEFVPDYLKDKLILCSCGRITPVKGYDLAVGAAEILKKSGLDFKWYFVGDGNCDIYVQPSYEEAHPLSIIEAQVLGKTIVSTATVGGLSIINDGENGLIVDSNAKSIAQKIYLIHQDKDLKTTIHNNLEIIDYSKDYQRFRNDWEKLLEG